MLQEAIFMECVGEDATALVKQYIPSRILPVMKLTE